MPPPKDSLESDFAENGNPKCPHLLAQMQAALKIYGAVTSVECVSEDVKGTMVVRQYWLAQHKDMVTRWEFDFMRAASGWQIGYFGFNDQLPTWF